MPSPELFVVSVPCVGEEVLTIHAWYLRVVAVGAQPPETRRTGPRQHCAGNARLLAAPNRYLAAGSTTGSCLLESADDGTATVVGDPPVFLSRGCGDAAGEDRSWLAEPGADKDVFEAVGSNRRYPLAGAPG